jgi:hypothetical protein
MKNPWPYSIIGFFAIAITGVAAFISFAMRQNVDLVRPDYYDHEMRFQEHIERLARTRALGSQVTVDYNAKTEALQLRVPHAATGRLKLYRPSNAALDREYEVRLEGVASHNIEAKDLQPGVWRAQLSWTANALEYYLESEFIVP